MRGVFLDLGTVSNGDLDTASLSAVLPASSSMSQTPQEQVGRRIAGCEVVLLNKCRISREMMAANPQLKLVALTATGVDNVDVRGRARARPSQSPT